MPSARTATAATNSITSAVRAPQTQPFFGLAAASAVPAVPAPAGDVASDVVDGAGAGDAMAAAGAAWISGDGSMGRQYGGTGRRVKASERPHRPADVPVQRERATLGWDVPLETAPAWTMTIDLAALFIPETPLLEIFIRGTATYLALFVLLRLTLKRQSGAVGMTDLLVVILIADAAQNAMAGDYRSIADGVVLVATILFWAYAIDWLGYHVPAIERLVHPLPLPLVANGALLPRNMRSELI